LPEVLDILNEALLLQKFLIIRREASLTVLPADERIDPSLLPRIRPDELKSRGKTEIVSTVYQLNTLLVDDIVSEVNRMKSPFGEISGVRKANQLLMQDTVGSLQRIIKTLEDMEANEKGQDTYIHNCTYIRARDAEQRLKDLLADARTTINERLPANQNQG